MAFMKAEPLFTSNRECLLWALTLALVVAIYSTLGLATTLADELRNRDLFDTVAAGAFLLMIPAVVMTALKTRPRGVEIGVALGVVIVYLMVFPNGQPDRTLPSDRIRPSCDLHI